MYIRHGTIYIAALSWLKNKTSLTAELHLPSTRLPTPRRPPDNPSDPRRTGSTLGGGVTATRFSFRGAPIVFRRPIILYIYIRHAEHGNEYIPSSSIYYTSINYIIRFMTRDRKSGQFAPERPSVHGDDLCSHTLSVT